MVWIWKSGPLPAEAKVNLALSEKIHCWCVTCFCFCFVLMKEVQIPNSSLLRRNESVAQEIWRTLLHDKSYRMHQRSKNHSAVHTASRHYNISPEVQAPFNGEGAMRYRHKKAESHMLKPPVWLQAWITDMTNDTL